MGRKAVQRDVAIYKGDTFVMWGDITEVAKKLGKSRRDIQCLCAPSVRKRLEHRENAMYGIYIEDEVTKND